MPKQIEINTKEKITKDNPVIRSYKLIIKSATPAVIQYVTDQNQSKLSPQKKNAIQLQNYLER